MNRARIRRPNLAVFLSQIMISLQQYIIRWIHQLRAWLRDLLDRWWGEVLVFESDSHIKVRVGRTPIAEGGFSVVFRATDLLQKQNVKVEYALKRIQCQDEEMRQACLQEAQVHQTLQRGQPQNAKYLMPLYGMTWADNHRVCYMLFPLFPYSLQQEVNRRFGGNTNVFESLLAPWNNESIVLQLFLHLLHAVATMHAAGYAHCDIKIDNILLQGSNSMHPHLTKPVLMDFGSAISPLSRPLATRRDSLEIAELASQHTTLSYRPPELFPGELLTMTAAAVVGDDTTTTKDHLDYAKVDVWSCGCVLFAILFGASPNESEFHRRTGRLQIVDCTQLKVLQTHLPRPPAHLPPSQWYSSDMWQLMEWILTKDRHQRPTIAQVQARVRQMLSSTSSTLHPGVAATTTTAGKVPMHVDVDVEAPPSNTSFFEQAPFAAFQ